MGITGPNQGASRAAFVLEDLGKNPVLACPSFWTLLASLGSRPHHSHPRCHHHISFCTSDPPASLLPINENPRDYLDPA